MTWLEALREECARTSQAQAARRLGVSTSMVNQVLKGSYGSDTSRLEARVRAELMAESIVCPIVGQLALTACQQHQARPFAATNPMRVALYRACRSGCPHSGLKEGQ